jgi:HSP90 family molecular chaperone
VKLLRFKTSKSEGKWVSLDTYIKRAKEWQQVNERAQDGKHTTFCMPHQVIVD